LYALSVPKGETVTRVAIETFTKYRANKTLMEFKKFAYFGIKVPQNIIMAKENEAA
jgi:hypothetical protein